MRLRIAFIAAVLCGVCGVALAEDDPYALAESLASRREFLQAEREYRRQLASRPDDWRLRLGLARVILWSGRYREAERHFATLLRERPSDPDLLLGHAQSAYWWGDFRAAERRYGRLLKVVPDHAEAQKALQDLATITAATYEVTTSYAGDSQPYDVATGRMIASWFSDPLTRWDLRGAIGNVAGGEEMLQSFGGGFSAGFPPARLRAHGWAESFRFADGEREAIGALTLERRLTAATFFSVSADREPLLATAVSVDDHATATRYAAGWRLDSPSRWLAAVNAYRVTFSDDNRGSGADGWFVAPLLARDGFLLRGGASAAWRDTELNRFRFTTFESRELDSTTWQYTYTGVYDPYWTPHDLREARLILIAEWPRVKLQADAGYARDRAIGYGPSTGTTPNPLFIFPHMQDRSFKPWRVGAEVRWPLGSNLELRTRYRHNVTVFYRANEFEASLGGRI